MGFLLSPGQVKTWIAGFVVAAYLKMQIGLRAVFR